LIIFQYIYEKKIVTITYTMIQRKEQAYQQGTSKLSLDDDNKASYEMKSLTNNNMTI